MMRTSKIGISAALCLGLLEGTSRDAHACGGFFCRQVPVDQTGEQIIFSVAPNHVTAHIQINYSGSASEFATMRSIVAMLSSDARASICRTASRATATVGPSSPFVRIA